MFLKRFSINMTGSSVTSTCSLPVSGSGSRVGPQWPSLVSDHTQHHPHWAMGFLWSWTWVLNRSYLSLRLSAWGVFILSQANPGPATAHGPTCPSAGPCRHQSVQPDTGAANPAAAAGQTEAAPGAPAEEDRTGAGADQSSAGTTTWGCNITVSQSRVCITIQGFRLKLKPEHYLSAVMAIHCFKNPETPRMC